MSTIAGSSLGSTGVQIFWEYDFNSRHTSSRLHAVEISETFYSFQNDTGPMNAQFSSMADPYISTVRFAPSTHAGGIRTTMSARKIDNRQFRKRTKNIFPTEACYSGNLVEDTPPRQPDVNNVVERYKVRHYLDRLEHPAQVMSSCLKMILCDSEAMILIEREEDALKREFGISSVSFSDAAHSSVDRIVTLYGSFNNVLRCALFIAYLVCAETNNLFRNEPYTLKSQNYSLSVLIEGKHESIWHLLKGESVKSVDASVYGRNSNLHLVKLCSDFVSLFKSLALFLSNFTYKRYYNDDVIEITPFITIHDGDFLNPDKKSKDEKGEVDKEDVMTFISRNLQSRGLQESCERRGD